MNMFNWVEKMKWTEDKKALPILSFPSVQLLYVTVKELVSSSALQAMGMRMISDKYNMPAALSFMDLSVEAEAFGAHTVYAADEVPTIIGQVVATREQADALKVPQVGDGRTGVNIDAIKKAVKLIVNKPVFAGCTGPFSLAGRLMNVNEVMVYLYEEPEIVHTVLRKATDFLIEYIEEYKKAGADGIVLAEPLAGLLSPKLIKEFSTKYVREIVEAVQDKGFLVIYHNCGNEVPKLVEQILETGCIVFHFGDSVNMAEMLRMIPSYCLVMGNISPSKQFLSGTPKSIRMATTRLLESCKQYKNFMISSGCDIPPLTEFDNIDAFFETVDSFYYRQKLWDMIT
jgi:uroporphyrinogen decarboxylase